jgi:hypothetical protein
MRKIELSALPKWEMEEHSIDSDEYYEEGGFNEENESVHELDER